MKNQFFKASLDTVSKIITSLLTPLFTIFPLYVFFSVMQQPDKNAMTAFILFIVILIAIFVGTFLYWVSGYTITDTELIIHRKIGQKKYLIASFVNAKVVTTNEMGFVVRLLGNGGMFGYTGFFTSKVFGRMQWYVTNKQNLILITLNNEKKIVISPDDMTGFGQLIMQV